MLQQNVDDKERPSNCDQHEIKNAIKHFDKEQCIELFKIIQKHTTNYTHNSNGIFINLKTLSTPAVCEIQQYVNYIQATNMELSKRYLKNNVK